jgi:hypothetical protein
MIHLLQAGAKVLLLVSVLEGMLLAGGGLGWLFTRLWRPTPAGAVGWRRLTADRYRVGALYGLVIGLALVAIHRRRAAVTRRRVVADSVPGSDARVGAPPVEQKLQVSAQATEPVSFSPGP